jgi:hypothetical protein
MRQEENLKQEKQIKEPRLRLNIFPLQNKPHCSKNELEAIKTRSD